MEKQRTLKKTLLITKSGLRLKLIVNTDKYHLVASLGIRGGHNQRYYQLPVDNSTQTTGRCSLFPHTNFLHKPCPTNWHKRNRTKKLISFVVNNVQRY